MLETISASMLATPRRPATVIPSAEPSCSLTIQVSLIPLSSKPYRRRQLISSSLARSSVVSHQSTRPLWYPLVASSLSITSSSLTNRLLARKRNLTIKLKLRLPHPKYKNLMLNQCSQSKQYSLGLNLGSGAVPPAPHWITFLDGLESGRVLANSDFAKLLLECFWHVSSPSIAQRDVGDDKGC